MSTCRSDLSAHVRGSRASCLFSLLVQKSSLRLTLHFAFACDELMESLSLSEIHPASKKELNAEELEVLSLPAAIGFKSGRLENVRPNSCFSDQRNSFLL